MRRNFFAFAALFSITFSFNAALTAQTSADDNEPDIATGVWHSNNKHGYRRALRLARKTNKAIVVFVGMKNCGGCTYYKEHVFPTAEVKNHLKDHILLEYYYSEDDQLVNKLMEQAQEMGARNNDDQTNFGEVPQILIYRKKGKDIYLMKYLVGPKKKETFIEETRHVLATTNEG